jgi:hypothetical protein
MSRSCQRRRQILKPKWHTIHFISYSYDLTSDLAISQSQRSANILYAARTFKCIASRCISCWQERGNLPCPQQTTTVLFEQRLFQQELLSSAVPHRTPSFANRNRALNEKAPAVHCNPVKLLGIPETFPCLDVQSRKILAHCSRIGVAVKALSARDAFRMRSDRANRFRVEAHDTYNFDKIEHTEGRGKPG